MFQYVSIILNYKRTTTALKNQLIANGNKIEFSRVPFATGKNNLHKELVN